MVLVCLCCCIGCYLLCKPNRVEVVDEEIVDEEVVEDEVVEENVEVVEIVNTTSNQLVDPYGTA